MEPRPLYVVAFGTGVTIALLLLLRLGQRIFSPKHTVSADLTHGNPAHRLLHVGQVLAVFLIAASAVRNTIEGQDLKRDVIWASAMALLGLLLLVASGRVGIMLLLRSRLPAEVERGNVAAGVAAGAHYVATGIITARAVAGNDLQSLGLSLAFFVLAQVTLHVFVSLFRALTVYDDAEQIQGENLAAAISYGGVAIAVSILIARALEGDFVSWGVSLRGYGIALLFAFALWPVRQLFVQTLLLGFTPTIRGGKLDDAIAAHRNEGMGILEAVTYIATAISITRLA